MENLNSILRDESYNDQFLIEELSSYIKYHRDNNLEINENFLIDIVNIILINSDLYVKEIRMIDDNVLGNASTKFVAFNFDKIINTAISKDNKKLYNCNDERLLKYFYILRTTIHEITHARQDLYAKYNDLYMASNIFIVGNRNEYNRLHNLVPTERYAYARCFKMAYQVLNKLYDKKDIEMVRTSFIRYLGAAYSYIYQNMRQREGFISPIDEFNNIISKYGIPKINLDFSDYDSLYSRFYLGLPISIEEFIRIKKIYDAMKNGETVGINMKNLIK